MNPVHPLTTRLRDHIADHWHHHAAIWSILACVLTFVLGAGATYAFSGHGGYHKGPLPPRISVSQQLGGAIPASASLAPYIVRIHNQGNSNSCTGQTASTITEITTNERRVLTRSGKLPGHPEWFSSGFVYNQVNGGSDNGASYQAVFELLRTQGDSSYMAFPHEGTDWWVQPDDRTKANAAKHRISSWRSIAPADRYTASYEIAHGRPIAIAIPVTDTFYNAWQTNGIATVWGQSGPLHFFHSITGVAYDPNGVIILNSWGAAYGHYGLIRLSWGFLQSVNAAIVVSQPADPIHHPTKPAPTNTPTHH